MEWRRRLPWNSHSRQDRIVGKPVRRVADTSAESADTISCVELARYKQKQPPRQTILDVPLPGFGLPGSRLRCAVCCNLLQTVADASQQPKPLQTVHKLLQSGCKTRKSANSASRSVCAIPFLSEGATSAIPMDSNSTPRRRKAGSDMVLLRSLLSVQPATSTGQVTAAWGD